MEEYVQQILKTMNEINDEFGDTEQPTGRLNIGHGRNCYKLPHVLSMFRISCPKVSLSIDTDVTEKNYQEGSRQKH
ncbi:hypothetical protein [Staphylococcus equorum]|uniref:hypothetical protein n=1 Tax=Staphylococcus equorum TaxID=246432 RepID=UPI0009BD776B|nr:hypothetical protein [Staphylococcus equorum]